MEYKAFISYRHSENGRRHAVALETALKRYAKPTLARPMKIKQTGLPKQEDYARAKRLWQACLASGVDNEYFQKGLDELERVWKEKTE